MTKLPPGWVATTIGDIAETQLGKMLSAKARTGNGSRPYLRNKNVQWGRIDLDDLLQMDFTDQEFEKFRLHPGDLLVCEGGVAGRAAVWRGSIDCAFQKALHRVRPRGDVLPEYLLYLLMHYGHTHAFERYVTGSTIAHLPQEDLRRLPVPLPPLAEQRRIVTAIEELLSRVDQAMVSLERAAEKLAALRRAVIDRAATHATTTWGMTPVTEVCDPIVNGNTPPPDRMTSGAGDIPFIKVYNLTLTGELDFSKKPTFIDRETHERRLRRSRLVPGDVLINIVGPPLGKVAVVPASYPEWNTNQAVVAFRPFEGGIRSELLAFWLMSRPILAPLIATAKATAGQFNLSISACRRLNVPVPPVEEQARLVADIQRQLSLVDSLSSARAGALGRSATLRTSVLNRAFRGELVPQDPNDEPASVLLERILSEGAEAPKATRRRRAWASA